MGYFMLLYASLYDFTLLYASPSQQASHRRWYDVILTLCAHWVTTRESHVAILVKFRPVLKEKIAWRTDRQKNNVVIAHPYHAGKSCSKFGLIPPSGLGGSVRADGQTNGRTGGRTDEKIMYSQGSKVIPQRQKSHKVQCIFMLTKTK